MRLSGATPLTWLPHREPAQRTAKETVSHPGDSSGKRLVRVLDSGFRLGGVWVPRHRDRAHPHRALEHGGPRGHTRRFSNRTSTTHILSCGAIARADTITATGPLQFRPAVEPLAEDMATEGRAGPGMALLRSALAKAPDAYFISIGSGAVGRQLRPVRELQEGRPVLRIRDATGACLCEAVPRSEPCSPCSGANEFWGNDPKAEWFAECLRQLISDVREELENRSCRS